MPHEYTETFEQILKDTSPQTPGIIRELALRELRLACREFFERSYAWILEVPNIDTAAGNVPTKIVVLEDGVGPAADDNVEVIGILTLTLRNIRIPPIGQRPPLDDPDFTSDAPRGWFITSNPDEFLYFPRLETSLVGETDAVVAVVPSFDAIELPRQITLKFYDAIIEGYLARVYNHPNKPYSNPAVAAQMRHNFLRRIGFYMAQRKQGFNNSQQWTYPPSFNVRRLGGNG